MSDKKNQPEKEAPLTAEAVVKKGQAAAAFAKQNVLANVPEELREALATLDLDELVGIAPAWKPEAKEEWFAGRVLSLRKGVGKYKSTVITVQGQSKSEGWVTRSIWLGADLTTKLGDGDPTDHNLLFVFDGWLTQKDIPSMAGEKMRNFRVFRVRGLKA